ncbi:hypothetical protein KP509_02G044800 [Ceratopteris richardii]|uniref:Uncharacterized protein n=1 Tax=Ceratopteris richardii TaxID=49495 RepID=A0A8T2V8F3_CERRI|nr:hypothetical protein KP509_02G044800 [Ceratopteris richardii]
MMDDSRVLAELGYKYMWPKLAKFRRLNTDKFPTRQLLICCERRISPSRKIWIGQFCSMAMAAHAHDLIAETWGLPDRHYKSSELLQSKAEELRNDLGDLTVDNRVTKKKITDHAFAYACLFPCSDSKRTLLACFNTWVTLRGPGPKCVVRIQSPPSDDEVALLFYPDDLLPPLITPALSKSSEAPNPRRSDRRQRIDYSQIVGIQDLENAMDVEPDAVSFELMSDPGEVGKIRYIYEQWTWCTRADKNETNKTKWNRPNVPYPLSESSTFLETPTFVSGPRDSRPFSFLNHQIYDNINNLIAMGPKATAYRICEWKGTSLEKFDASQI